ncbi:hypothetical protein M1145_00930, partial [Patescibacteria group bacterium]|nr:hypothetical protein [Patescibacteria group bacterium]
MTKFFIILASVLVCGGVIFIVGSYQFTNSLLKTANHNQASYLKSKLSSFIPANLMENGNFSVISANGMPFGYKYISGSTSSNTYISSNKGMNGGNALVFESLKNSPVEGIQNTTYKINGNSSYTYSLFTKFVPTISEGHATIILGFTNGISTVYSQNFQILSSPSFTRIYITYKDNGQSLSPIVLVHSSVPGKIYIDNMMVEKGTLLSGYINTRPQIVQTKYGTGIYPISSKNTSIGTEKAPFSSMYLQNAYIDLQGNETLQGTITALKGASFGNNSIGSTINILNTNIAGDLIPNIGNVYNLGSPSMYWNKIYADSILASGGTLQGNLTVSGITNTGTLQNNGDEILNGNIDISGTTVIGKTLGVSGDTNINANLTVTGTTTTNGITNTGNISVSGNGTFGGNISATGSGSFSGNLTVQGINANTISGNTTLNNDLSVKGSEIVSGNINISGITNTGGIVNASGTNISDNGSLTVAQNTSLSTLSTSNLASLNSLSVANSTNLGGTLSVTGASSFASTINVAGITTTNDITNTGTLSNNGNISVSGNGTFGGNVSVTGSGSFSGNLTVQGINANTISGNTTLNNNLTVTGTTTTNGITNTGNISTSNVYQISGGTILSNLGNNNIFVGIGAGYSNTTGSYNSFVGTSAGLSNTTGYQNSFLGMSAGFSNTTGSNNSFVVV